jgi:uncharacterized membrane protein
LFFNREVSYFFRLDKDFFEAFMKKYLLRLFLALAIFLTFTATEPLLAAVKITVKNNTPKNVFVAFSWHGLDTPDDKAKGWFKTAPGETKVFTLNEPNLNFSKDGFGYYAFNSSLVWRDNKARESMTYYIHPTQPFTAGHESNKKGFKKAGFKRLKLTKTSTNKDGSINGKATLTFNP